MRIVTVCISTPDKEDVAYKFVKCQFVVEDINDKELSILVANIESSGYVFHWAADEFGNYIDGWN